MDSARIRRPCRFATVVFEPCCNFRDLSFGVALWTSGLLTTRDDQASSYLTFQEFGGFLGCRVASGIHVSTHLYQCVSPRESAGCPEEWPLWTRRTGVSRTYPLATKQLAASVGGIGQSHLPRLDKLLNSKLAYAFT